MQATRCAPRCGECHQGCRRADTAGDTAGGGRELAVLGRGSTDEGAASASHHPRHASSSPTADAAAAAEWEMDPADIVFSVDPATGGRWCLGRGGQGDVYRATYQGSTAVAVKLVAGASPREQARFANEVAILKALRHTNVVQVRAVRGERRSGRRRGSREEARGLIKTDSLPFFFSTPFQFLGAALEPSPAPPVHEDDDSAPPRPGPRIMLVVEYMARGDLWRALAKDHQAGGGGNGGGGGGGSGGTSGPPSTSGGGGGGPPPSSAGRVFGWYRRGRGVALDVTRGLAFMHSKKVLHCDVKSSNILLGRDGTCVVFWRKKFWKARAGMEGGDGERGFSFFCPSAPNLAPSLSPSFGEREREKAGAGGWFSSSASLLHTSARPPPTSLTPLSPPSPSLPPTAPSWRTWAWPASSPGTRP